MESRKRSVVMAVIWNAIGLAVMACVGFVAAGSRSAGGAMALVTAALGLSLCVVSGRVRAQIDRGRNA